MTVVLIRFIWFLPNSICDRTNYMEYLTIASFVTLLFPLGAVFGLITIYLLAVNKDEFDQKTVNAEGKNTIDNKNAALT